MFLDPSLLDIGLFSCDVWSVFVSLWEIHCMRSDWNGGKDSKSCCVPGISTKMVTAVGCGWKFLLFDYIQSRI